MAKQHQPRGFSVPEAPPAYFPPVVSQQAGMTNSESYPMSYIPGSGVPGVHPDQTGPLAPAPYQNQVVRPGQYVLEVLPESPNPLPAILARENKLSFHTNQRIAHGQSSLMVQIRGTENQLVMSAIMVTVGVPTAIATNGAVNRVITEPRSTIIFNDPTGRNLMKCKQFEAVELHVTLEDEFLGAIRADLNCCDLFLQRRRISSFHAESGNGERYFETGNKGSEFYFDRNGTKLATAREGVINGDDFGVEFLGTVDFQTKAMIVAVCHTMFVSHFVDTARCCSIL